MDLLNPAGGGGLSVAKLALADALAADVLSGKKFYAADKMLKIGTRSKGTLLYSSGSFSGESSSRTLSVGFVPLYFFAVGAKNNSTNPSSLFISAYCDRPYSGTVTPYGNTVVAMRTSVNLNIHTNAAMVTFDAVKEEIRLNFAAYSASEHTYGISELPAIRWYAFGE